MKPGVHRGLSFEDYLAIDAVNKSNLDWMKFSPMHYWTYCVSPNRPKDEPTSPMKLGTAIHTALLEPSKFKSRYLQIPADAPKKPTKTQLEAKKPSDDTVIAIEWWKKFREEAGDRELLDADDWDRCKKIHAAVRKNPSAQAIMETGESEVVIVWEDPIEGILCKGRIDWLSTVILDLKSTDSARPDDFAKKVVNYEWHVQAAWYADGLKYATGEDLPFVFGAIEKDEPFASAFYVAQGNTIEIGRELYRRRLNRVAKCKATGDWPGYANEITAIQLPSWAAKELSSNGSIEY